MSLLNRLICAIVDHDWYYGYKYRRCDRCTKEEP